MVVSYSEMLKVSLRRLESVFNKAAWKKLWATKPRPKRYENWKKFILTLGFGMWISAYRRAGQTCGLLATFLCKEIMFKNCGHYPTPLRSLTHNFCVEISVLSTTIPQFLWIFRTLRGSLRYGRGVIARKNSIFVVIEWWGIEMA